MPYKLRKAPKRDLYWVVTSETGKKHSKDPIPKDKAKAQKRILEKALRGGADDGDDAEIAALMAGLNVQEPVQFAPPPLHHAALAANLFEQPPRPPRRKRGVKRAISTVQGTIYENAPKKQKTGKGRKMKGGRLSETWPMLKAHLDEATGKKEFILLPTNQQKSYLIEQMKGAILEMIPLIDEPQEKKELSTRGITYIGRIMSGTFISDVFQEQELKEGLAEVARKPIPQIIGAPTIEDIPIFRRLHVSQHPSAGDPEAATNPTDQRYYYKQSFTNEPYPTEESVELEPTSRDKILTKLLEINQNTGEYYDDLIRAGVEEALTPKQAEEKRKREKELRIKQEKALAERKKASAGEVYTGKGKGKCQCKPPYHEYSKGKASVFVLTCIDPRYTFDVAYYLQHKKELHQDYDLFTLAGASVGAEKKEWTKTFFDNLELGLKLHGIKEVWCFDHLDCGMYKATFGLKKDLDPKIHIQCMDKLKKLIKKKHPQLKFRSFLVNAKGHVSSV